MGKGNTREKILEVSLRLFSQHGYSAVSIRDICKEVGIRESTVYYHFENKQAILETLKNHFQGVTQSLLSRLFAGVGERKAVDEISMDAVSDVFFEQYLMDAFCNRFLRVMAIEQHHNPAIRAYYQEWVLEKPLQIQSVVFGKLTEQGLFAGREPSYLALQYYAPIFFYLQKYLLAGELNEEKKERFRKAVGEHLALLMKEWGKG